jgi:hypothetical protein
VPLSYDVRFSSQRDDRWKIVIVGKIVEHLKQSAPTGAHVSLIADGDAWHLYAQFGFEPTAPASIGMAFSIPDECEGCDPSSGGPQIFFAFFAVSLD